MSGLSSVYPPPPHFYKHFTNDNVKKVDETPEGERDGLEEPLSYLVPPKAPEDTYYRMFGNIWDPKQSDLQSLEQAGIKQLYSPLTSSSDRMYELKKLLKSLLANYLELVGIMSIAPEKFPAKTEDLRVILINMHHLLNEYRPHQSRESLVLLMEEQIASKRKEIEHLRSTNHSIQKRIKRMALDFNQVEVAKSPDPIRGGIEDIHKRLEGIVVSGGDNGSLFEDEDSVQSLRKIREQDMKLWEAVNN